MRKKLEEAMDPTDPTGCRYLLNYKNIPSEKQLQSLFSRLEKTRVAGLMTKITWEIKYQFRSQDLDREGCESAKDDQGTENCKYSIKVECEINEGRDEKEKCSDRIGRIGRQCY